MGNAWTVITHLAKMSYDRSGELTAEVHGYCARVFFSDGDWDWIALKTFFFLVKIELTILAANLSI